MVSVLFVCLGNICRSPLAEAAFRREAERLGLDAKAASAGTGDWHVGKRAHSRAIAAAARNAVDISSHRARQVALRDFRDFDHIVAMDGENLRNLRRLQPPDATATLSLLFDHVEGREGEAVADPYYGEAGHFEVTWRDVEQGARALARKLAAQA